MKRFLFLLLCLPTVITAQWRMVSSSVSLNSTVDDSTYVIDVDFFSDLTGGGYLATGITADFLVFSQSGELYDITAATNLTLSSGRLTIVEVDNDYVDTEGAPTGQIIVYDPQGEYIPVTPFGNSNMGNVLQGAAIAYNSKIKNQLAIATIDDTSSMISPYEGQLVYIKDAGSYQVRGAYTWSALDPGGGGSGDVTGPGTSTDNAIATFNGTGNTIQSSSASVDESGNISTSGTVDGRDVSVDGAKLDGIESGATADQSDEEIETAYNNQVSVVSKALAEAGTDTTAHRWTSERVGQAIRGQVQYNQGSNNLKGLLGFNSKNFNTEFDYVPNIFATTPPKLNLFCPDVNYNTGGTMLIVSGSATFTYNIAENEFAELKADKFVANSTTNGKLVMQFNSAIYPALLPGDYAMTWKMRAETGVDTIKYGVFNSETANIELDTTWTQFSRSFTYTGGTIYTTIVGEDSSDISVLVGDIILTPDYYPYRIESQASDGHAYSVFPNNFRFESSLLYEPKLSISPSDSIDFDTVCITAVVRPDWVNSPAYGSILSSVEDYNNFWFGTFTDSLFTTGGATGDTIPTLTKVQNNSYLHTNRGYVIVIQHTGPVRKAYLNGVLVRQVETNPDITLKDFRIGRLNNGSTYNFPGYIEEISVYRGVADPALLTNQLMSFTQLGKEVRTDKCVFGEGDSITASGNAACRLSSKKTKIVTSNFSVGGSAMSHVNSRKSALKDAIAQARKVIDKVIVTLHIGANDLSDSTTYYNTVMSYVREIKNTGALVVLCTILPQNAQPGVFETHRNGFNNLIRATSSAELDGVVDYDTTIMGDYSTTSNLTYYSDGTHPTLAGQQLMEAVYTAIINSL